MRCSHQTAGEVWDETPVLTLSPLFLWTPALPWKVMLIITSVNNGFSRTVTGVFEKLMVGRGLDFTLYSTWVMTALQKLDSYANKTLEDKLKKCLKNESVWCIYATSLSWMKAKCDVCGSIRAGRLASLAMLSNECSNYAPRWKFGLIKPKSCQLVSQIISIEGKFYS